MTGFGTGIGPLLCRIYPAGKFSDMNIAELKCLYPGNFSKSITFIM